MGREVRMVPPDWRHPKNEKGNYIPMWARSYENAVRDWEAEDLPEWIEGARLWATGLVKSSRGTETIDEVVARTEEYRRPQTYPTYEWWAGDVPRKPRPEDYMPDWPAEQRTHFMMYEDTSEGTPISPAFATAEELARWLADTGASAFAGMTATYEQWLGTINRGSAFSAVLNPATGEMKSGVEALGESR